MIIFAATDPLVLNGTYDREGYKPGERARIAKARARQLQGDQSMAKAKKKRASRTDRKLARPDKPARGRPRQALLPGTEDHAIKPLEDVAASYAEVRDERMDLNKREHELKQHALKLMKKYEKTIYRRDGIEIRVVAGEDDVKVRIKKPGEEESEDADDQVEIDADAEGDADAGHATQL